MSLKKEPEAAVLLLVVAGTLFFCFRDGVATGSSSVVALMGQTPLGLRHSLQVDEADEQRYRVYAPLSIVAAS
jgi:hypothetical protein